VKKGAKRYADWKIAEEDREEYPFPYWLNQRLLERGWNANKLAAEIDVVPSLVSRWMTATQTPSAESLKAIAEALQLSELEVLVAAGHLSPELVSDDPRKAELKRKIDEVDLTPDRYRLLNALLGAMTEVESLEETPARRG
jgi:transcriptional regulator with XRE-family HTH domain